MFIRLFMLAILILLNGCGASRRGGGQFFLFPRDYSGVQKQHGKWEKEFSERFQDKNIAHEELKAIAQSDGLECSPEWSPHRDYFAYEEERSVEEHSRKVSKTNIWMKSQDGSQTKTVRPMETSSSFEEEKIYESSDYSIDWSPDGAYLAMAVEKNGNRDLGICSLEHGEQEKGGLLTGFQRVRWLTDNPGFDGNPDWSIEDKIAYASDVHGSCQIWYYDLTANHWKPTQVTHVPGAAFSPQWSPNGKEIVFTVRKTGREDDDIELRELGTGRPYVVADSDEDERFPSWSPDGRMIAYFSGNKICVKSRDALHLDPEWIVSQVYVPTRCKGPVWTPDSRGIIYVSTVDFNHPIYVADLERKEPYELIPWRKAKFNEEISLSPDGNMLLFRSYQRNNHDIWFAKLKPATIVVKQEIVIKKKINFWGRIAKKAKKRGRIEMKVYLLKEEEEKRLSETDKMLALSFEPIPREGKKDVFTIVGKIEEHLEYIKLRLDPETLQGGDRITISVREEDQITRPPDMK